MPPGLFALRRESGLRLTGRVASGAAVLGRSARFELAVETVAGRALAARCFLLYHGDAPELLPGQRIAVQGGLRVARSPINPGDFDERTFYADRGISFSFLVAPGSTRILAAPRWLWAPYSTGEKLHQSIHRFLASRFERSTAWVLEGVLLGYKGRLPALEQGWFRDSGTIHLLVPSGAKVAFVALAALRLLGWLALPRLPRGLAAGAIGLLYVFAVGGEPPYVRAYLCFLLAWQLTPWERGFCPYQAVLWSALAVLAWEPRRLFQAGFQMTYAAAFFMLLYSRLFPEAGRWGALRRALAATAIAQLSLAPISAVDFGRVSISGFLANLVMIPAAAVLMAAGFLAWLQSLLLPAAACAPLQRLLALGAQALTWAARFFASWPCAAVDAPAFGLWTAAGLYLALAAPALSSRWPRRCAFAAACALLGWRLWVWRLPRVEAVFLADARRPAAVVLDGRRAQWIGASWSPARQKRVLLALGVGDAGHAASRLELKTACGAIRFDPAGVSRATVRFGDRVSQYCILALHPKTPPAGCMSGAVLSTEKAGAIWVRLNDDHGSVSTQRKLHPLRRLVL